MLLLPETLVKKKIEGFCLATYLNYKTISEKKSKGGNLLSWLQPIIHQEF